MNIVQHTAPTSVAARAEPFTGFDKKLEKVRTLMGGTEAMQRAAKTYLPKFESEAEDHYTMRRNMSYLYNGFGKTVRDFTGRVFEKPVTLIDETNQDIHSWIEDIDLDGRTLNDFAKRVFENGMQSGIEYLLVDTPPKVPGISKREDRENNSRPFIKHLTPENVLGWRMGRIRNKTALTLFRFKENVEAPKDEFGSETIEQVRVLDLKAGETVRVRAFRQNTKGEWIQFGPEQFTGLDTITVTPFYANRVDFFKGSPPLEDLADLNIAHWRSQSDQNAILHAARVPILFGKGFDEGTAISISTATAAMAKDPRSDLKYVEHSGAAIGAGQKDLDHLVALMQTMGLQLLMERGSKTAAGENRDDKKETSRLAAMAQALEEALMICLNWMADYQNATLTGQIHVHKDFTAGSVSQPLLQIMAQAAAAGKLSRLTLWQELQRHGLLSSNFDPELEGVRLQDEVEPFDGLPIGNIGDENDE